MGSHQHMKPSFFRRPSSLWLLILLSFILNTLFLANDLPNVSHPDEPKVVRRAIAMGTGDLNPHFFVYPTLWTYMVFLVQSTGAVVGLALRLFKGMDHLASLAFTNPTFYFVAARLLSAALGAGAIWLTWRIGSHLSPLCGWVSGLTLALFPPFVWQSHYATGDVALTFFVLACLSACIDGLSASTKWRSIWWPSIAAGLATSVKYNGFVVFGAVALMLYFRTRGSAAGDGRGHASLRHSVLAGRILKAGLMATLGFLATSPFIALDAPEFVQGLRELVRGTVIVTGIRPDLLAYARLVVGEQGILFGVVSLAGWIALVATFCRRGRSSYPWVLAGFFLPYLVLIELADYKTPRFFLPMAAAMSLGVGAALSNLWERVRTLPVPMVLRAAVVSLAFVALLVPSVAGTTGVEREFSQPSASSVATKWFRTNVRPGSTVFVDIGTRVSLPPDRETVDERMRLWTADGSGKARQLLRAYTYYLKTGEASAGYRMVPTADLLQNTFASGLDPLRDYDIERLNGVRFLVAPQDVFDFGRNPGRDAFYNYAMERYSIIHRASGRKGEAILILETKGQ